MLSLLLACTTTVALATGTAAATAPATVPASHIRTIAWTAFGIDQSIRVYSDDARPWELALESRPNTWLRSIVGPIFSTVEFHTSIEDAPQHTAKIHTEIDQELSFDLVRWLDDSGQSGAVLQQLLSSARCSMEGQCTASTVAWPEHPHCPSSTSVAAWDGGLLELSRMLVATECFSDQDVGVQPESFWIDGWNDGVMTLAIQREHCDEASTDCRAEVSFVELAPPPAWRPWLDDAAGERGHLPRLAPKRAETEAAAEDPPLALPSLAANL